MQKYKYKRLTPAEQRQRLKRYRNAIAIGREMSFTRGEISEKALLKMIEAAGTAPSGANKQPWTYVLIKDKGLKRKIRLQAEKEENYSYSMSDISDKYFLEEAPYLIAIFRKKYGLKEDEQGNILKEKFYYTRESAGISAGFFIAASKYTGQDVRIHTPVKGLKKILKRPVNETPLLLLAVGYNEDGQEGNKAEQLQRAEEFYNIIKTRRSIRDFSRERIDIDLINQAIEAAVSVFKLVNDEDYPFMLVEDENKKIEIRKEAEKVEKKLYEEKISEEWRKDLKPLGTGWQKPHLTNAPCLIIASRASEELSQSFFDSGDPSLSKDAYATTTAVAIGILIGALHFAGYYTLTYTPSPIHFLSRLFDKLREERPVMILPVGYPAKDYQVPEISRKDINDYLVRQEFAHK